MVAMCLNAVPLSQFPDTLLALTTRMHKDAQPRTEQEFLPSTIVVLQLGGLTFHRQ
jgi:hypothetical protein